MREKEKMDREKRDCVHERQEAERERESGRECKREKRDGEREMDRECKRENRYCMAERQ